MPEVSPPKAPDRVFTILNTMLIVGVVITLVVLAVVRSVVPFDPMGDLVPIFRAAGLCLLVAGYLLIRMVRGGIPPLRVDADRTSWWAEYGRRALTLWVLAEGIAMVGGVFWFLTGDVVLLVVVSGVALALLVMNRPGRLVEG